MCAPTVLRLCLVCNYQADPGPTKSPSVSLHVPVCVFSLIPTRFFCCASVVFFALPALPSLSARRCRTAVVTGSTSRSKSSTEASTRQLGGSRGPRAPGGTPSRAASTPPSCVDLFVFASLLSSPCGVDSVCSLGVDLCRQENRLECVFSRVNCVSLSSGATFVWSWLKSVGIVLSPSHEKSPGARAGEACV